MTTEFSNELLDKVAKALFLHDAYGLPPDSWEDCSPTSRRNYIGFAQAALQAMHDNAGSDDQFLVRGVMPIEGHPDYGFTSPPIATLAEAETYREGWMERYEPEGAKLTIEHSSRVLLNTYRYWTQDELDRIDAMAKEHAERLKKYAK